MSVRVRYAPSPTGLQHIGGVRTSLYNYFFARAMGGKFYLRIEDTDQGRYDERALQDIYDTFEWLGIKLDEGPREGGPFGPYIQSERIQIYQEHARKLLDAGLAYRCFATAAELEAMRADQTARGLPVGYDRRYRDLDRQESDRRAAAGEPFVLRFKVPLEGEVKVFDILLGEVTFPVKDIPADPVIMKADGFPTYHLAHAVDDHLMQTTHVLRGQEWLPSSPLHVLLFQAFGWQPPVYCHLSMIMGADGKKLSKRHGSTSAQDFRLGGYVPQAVINYVTLLGWSYDGEREIFSPADLEQLFTLEKLSKSAAIFDYQKLDHFNGYWIRQMADADLAREVEPWLVRDGLIPAVDQPGAAAARQLVLDAMPVVRERLPKLTDAPTVMAFLFRDPDLTDPAILIPKKMDAAAVRQALERILPELDGFDRRSDAENEQHYHALVESWGVGLGKVLMPLRLAVTGSNSSPPLMSSIRLVGLERSRSRIRAAIQALG